MKKRDKKKRLDEQEIDNTKNMRLKESTLKSVWGIVLFVLSVFFLLAAYGNGGPVGTWTFSHIKTLLGYGYYLLPTIFLLLSVSFFGDQERSFPLSKALGSILFVVSGLGLFHLISEESGGIVGRLLATPLLSLFDYTISIISLLALLTISILIIYDAALRAEHLMIWKRLFSSKKDTAEALALGANGELLMPAERQKIIDAENKANMKGENKGQSMSNMSDIKDTTSGSANLAGGAYAASNTSGVDTKKGLTGGTVGTQTKNGDAGAVDNEMIQVSRKSMLLGKAFVPPPLSLLENDRGKPGVGDIKANANIIKRTLQNFGIDVEMDEVSIGPSVTRYALKPAEGVKLSKILGLQNNLSLALAAHPIRIEAPIPGKSLVGIEIPNSIKTTVGLGTLLAQDEFQKSEKPLMVALGKGISGKSYFGNLAKMPHLLIAGATGSGKSVTIQTIITSLLYRNSAENLRMIMIDPKRVELTLWNKIPHLLTPVITDAKKAILSLKWAAKEMDRRYNVLEKHTVRDIDSYHKNVVSPALEARKKDGFVAGEEETIDPMPYIVIVIDELADIMQTYPRELEAGIVRLAQMSRAVGIHLILSTQRPSVNVITGLIKANIPARIALQVASQIDSRTILDMRGAEELLGAGDMLYLGSEMPNPQRVQSAYISETELKKVVTYLVDNMDALPSEISISGESVTGGGSNGGTSAGGGYIDPIFSSATSGGMGDMGGFGDDSGEDDDDLYEDAKQTVIEAGKASTSYIQRKLRVGYARAARLMDILESRGVIGPADGAKPREVLAGKSDSNHNSGMTNTGSQNEEVTVDEAEVSNENEEINDSEEQRTY
ncbi:MAG: DNA translocase FtsK 4TM domain-containing protein [Candidatus Pacebacteria bacterium]|nr:DNA translocase FtsK 4TM domain-containing protein [Candidatus Paceibacterota bacterium]MBP9818964.1 DNA translocase FtsK 4TM domain-containing protein [Candidatus Paceibacterota bacterium]